MNKIKDWKGNEVKAGMVIHFVRTRPFNFGKFGVLIPQVFSLSGGPEEIWESEEEYKKRNEPIWELGEEMVIQEDENNRLFVTTVTKGINELEGITFNCKIDLLMQIKSSPDLTIAIKGISDKPDIHE